MAKTLFWLLMLALPGLADAAPPQIAQREIAQLMEALSTSGCRFQRNGRWYDAAEARTHLQRKYDYLQQKNLIDSSEQFIARAATESSMSGKAYRVGCPGQPEQTSASWFGGQLQRLRDSGR